MVTVGSIWGGTLRFVRDNIGPILIWSGIAVLSSLMFGAAMAPMYAARQAALDGGTAPSPNVAVMVASILLGVVVFTALWAAVLRAVLFPEQRRFAYLRLGMDELRLLGTMLAVFVGGYIVVVMVGAILIGIGAALGSARLGLAIAAIVFCVAIWAVVRISPAGPMTIAQRKVVIGPAWRLTRGAFWRLFGAYLLLAIATLIIYGIVMVVQMGPILPDLLRPTDPEAVARVARWQAAHYGGFSGAMIVSTILSGILGGIMLSIQGGMMAVATRDLLGVGTANLGEVFE